MWNSVKNASRVPGLQLRFTVEEVEPFSVWPGYRGRLSQIMLGLMAPDYLDREVFCCGPEPFMKAAREMLASLGFDMAHYHEESFGAPALEEVPVDTVAPSGQATDSPPPPSTKWITARAWLLTSTGSSCRPWRLHTMSIIWRMAVSAGGRANG